MAGRAGTGQNPKENTKVNLSQCHKKSYADRQRSMNNLMSSLVGLAAQIQIQRAQKLMEPFDYQDYSKND